MKTIVFLNTETLGLPIGKISTVTKANINKWPRVVALHLKFGYYDNITLQIQILRSIYCIVKPDGYIIPKEISDIHGITDEIANKEGLDIGNILNETKEIFIGNRDIHPVTTIITHNSKFHLNVLKAEFFRNNIDFDFSIYSMIDLVNFRHKLSYPKLDKLYESLYSKKFKKSHPRKSTINVIIKCFEKLYTIEESKKIVLTNETLGFDKDPLTLPTVKQDKISFKKH